MFCENVKIYQKGDKYLVLNPTVPAWVVTNINGVLVFKCYSGEKTFNEIAEDFNKHCPSFPISLVEKFLINADKRGMFKVVPRYDYCPCNLQHIYLHMTKKCNLQCSYCYTTERPEDGLHSLSIEDVEDILNQAYVINKDMCITFTGGEALIDQKTIPAAIYAKELGLQTYLLSNGTMINESNIEIVSKAFDHIKISVDGSTKEKYGRYRGEENYGIVEHAIKELIKRKVDVMVSMVVTRENKDDVENMACKWKGRLNFMPLFPLGSAKRNEKENVLRGSEYYFALAEKAGIEPFSDVINLLEKYGIPNLKCAMGDREISIAYNGDVYPCQLLHNENFYLGNVREKTICEILSSDYAKRLANHTVYEIAECKSCDFRLLCAGACQARHFSETGSLDRAGSFCEYEKEGIISGIINKAELYPMK